MTSASERRRRSVGRGGSSLGLRAVAMVICVTAAATSCGSGGSDSEASDTTVTEKRTSTSTTEPELDPSTTTTERVTTTTEPPPPPGVGPDELPFARCTQEEQFGPVTAEVSAWNPQTGGTRALAEGLEGVCNNGATLTRTYLTASGRYLVSIWPVSFDEPSATVVDLQTGAHSTVTETAVNRWATDRTGTGLGAQEVELTFTGFDRSGDGTLFLSDGSGEYSGDSFYRLAIGEFMNAGGTEVQLEALPEALTCYASFRWGPDGSRCNARGYYFDAATTSAAFEDQSFSGTRAAAPPQIASWFDATTVLWVEPGGRSLMKETPGEALLTELYAVPGERSLEVWVSTTLGKAFVVAPTLDKTRSEVFAIGLQPGEPQLITSMDPGVLPIDR